MLLAPALPASDVELCDDPVEVVRRVLNTPDGDLDYLDAKLTFDRLIDPFVSEEWIAAEIDALEAAARELAGPWPSDFATLSALRKVIYENGHLNGWRKFEYDHTNVRGEIFG